MTSQQIGVIGYGRFGRFWAQLLATHHQVMVTDKIANEAEHFVSLPTLCESSDVIFLCVPINQCERVVRDIKPHVRSGTAIFDTCSVKVHPANVLMSQLGSQDGLTLVATHPMFGPDSAAGGVQGLSMAFWRLAGDEGVYRGWLDFFAALGIRTIELSPDEHDRLAAYSQGLTHYVGRVLREMDVRPTPIDTQGFKILCSLIEQTCNDSWELFQDLQLFNPHTRTMRQRLEAALDSVSQRLERVQGAQD